MVFREMRRKRQQMAEAECVSVLEKNTSGVLALSGDGGYPYAVPLSYVFDAGKIYFHCAKTGHKIDAIQKNSRASFCVVDQDKIIPEKYTTHFRSVIVFGQIHIIDCEKEKRGAIEKLAVKYAPNDSEAGRQQAIDREWALLCMLRMDIEHMTGKEAIELVKCKTPVKMNE